MRSIFYTALASVFIVSTSSAMTDSSFIKNLIKMKADADRQSDIMDKTVFYLERIGNGPEKTLKDYRWFQKIDIDKDGKIPMQELSRYFKSVGINYSQKDVSDLFWSIDTNRDQTINWFEFKNALDSDLSLMKTDS